MLFLKTGTDSSFNVCPYSCVDFNLRKIPKDLMDKKNRIYDHCHLCGVLKYQSGDKEFYECRWCACRLCGDCHQEKVVPFFTSKYTGYDSSRYPTIHLHGLWGYDRETCEKSEVCASWRRWLQEEKLEEQKRIPITFFHINQQD